MTDEQAIENICLVDRETLLHLLSVFKERCAHEAEMEKNSARATGCGEGARFAGYAEKHIRQIDVDVWLRVFGKGS